MLSPRKAVQEAVAMFKEFSPEAKNLDLLVEEVVPEEELWAITLSYNGTGAFKTRNYRVVRLTKENGTFVSLRIREFDQ